MEQTNLKSRAILIAVVTALLLASLFHWGIRLGQDLEGGTTLRFSLDLDRAEATGRIDAENREKVVADTIKVIEDRINKFGLAEISLTPIGEDKFEISLPAGTEGDVDSIVGVVTALGDLKFRITVRPDAQYGSWDGETPPRLKEPGSSPWQGAEGFPATAEGYQAFFEAEVQRWKDARDTVTQYVPADPRYFVVPRTRGDASTIQDFALLEEPAESKYQFDGRILSDPQVGQGEAGRPEVYYNVKLDYQNAFGEWTGANVGLPMAIVLNEEFYSDPTIQSKLTDRVRITLGSGRSFKEQQAEAEQIATVLQTGSLKVRPKLESRTKVGARLAGEARQRGIYAVFVAFALVLLFMVVFYSKTGAVADFALFLNVVLLLGTLAFFRAVLTLPGIAGIVLTLGMAVDANILINERIREERLAGRSLRRAVSEGYARAFTTIVDANVTSLITAVFLYAFGTGPVRGFAVTLIIGLLASMFTAIFVTRTILEWGLKSGRFKDIRMLGTGEPPKISWVALRRYFAPLSTIGVIFGLLVFTLEDRTTFYDVDFTGGLKLQARFESDTTIDDVRDALEHDTQTVEVELEDPDGEVRVRREIVAGPYPQAQVVAVGDDNRGVEITIQREGGEEAEAEPELEQKTFEAYVRKSLGARLLPDWVADGPRSYEAPATAEPELRALDGGIYVRVTLLDPAGVLTSERIQEAIATRMPYWTRRGSEVVRNPASTVDRTVVVRPVEGPANPSYDSYDIWMKTTNKATSNVVETDPPRVRSALSEFLGGAGLKNALMDAGVGEAETKDVTLSTPFPSVDLIGSSVARRLQNDALIALVLSLLGIIAYIAFRFSSRAMGLAAVICLFHDVAITLGIVALANIFGVVDAKISLPMVAAFLTLVGYSVNDTVVVFDRIRENRGKKQVITPAMIDLSINQTLARSIKTSATFLLAALALFVINYGQRNVLEGFAFILIIGSVIGTYSTVAIASPLLLFLPWLWERIQGLRPRAAIVTQPASHVWGLPLVPFTAVLWFLWAVAFVVVGFLIGLVLFPVWALTVKVETEVAEEDLLPAPA